MPTSQLAAVNVALSMLGEAPVNSLSPAPTPVAALAESILAEVTEEVQGEGWRFNLEYDVDLTPDGGGEVVLNDVISVSGERWGRDLSLRGVQLWDGDSNTTVFSGTPRVDLVRRLDWDDLPEAARLYVARRTGRELLSRVFPDRARLLIAGQAEATARAALQVQEQRGDPSSMLDAWPQALIRTRRSPGVW